MGWPIYVYAYVRCDEDGKYYYVEVYGGKSWIKAIFAARKAKREGSGCIKVEWR